MINPGENTGNKYMQAAFFYYETISISDIAGSYLS